MLYCCEECPHYELCSESGTLMEGCCKKCTYYDECHLEENEDEEETE